MSRDERKIGRRDFRHGASAVGAEIAPPGRQPTRDRARVRHQGTLGDGAVASHSQARSALRRGNARLSRMAHLVHLSALERKRRGRDLREFRDTEPRQARGRLGDRRQLRPNDRPVKGGRRGVDGLAPRTPRPVRPLRRARPALCAGLPLSTPRSIGQSRATASRWTPITAGWRSSSAARCRACQS